MTNEVLLAEIARKVENCRNCDLWRNATHGVPGEGSPNAKVVFIGEGPGFHEDKEGRPFIGAAGKLLTKVLLEIGLSREDVFIGNVVKHRPPENRDPLLEELIACKPWLDQQLAILRPRLIVTLGRFSLARYFPNVRISEVRGNIVRVGKQAVLPMYHPAAALRSGAMMAAFRNDFLKHKEVMLNPSLLDNFNNDDEDKGPQLDLLN